MTNLPAKTPVLGGSAVSRAKAVLLVVLVLTPPTAWLLSLFGSYIIDDFVCTAAASAGASPPAAGVLTAVIVMNAVLVIVTVASGAIAFRMGLRARGHQPTVAFLGMSTLPSAVVFGYGMVFIAVTGMILGGCS